MGKPADKSDLKVTLAPVANNLYVIRGADGRNLSKPLRLAEYKRLVSQAHTVAGLNRRLGDTNDPRIDLLLGLKDSTVLKGQR